MGDDLPSGRQPPRFNLLESTMIPERRIDLNQKTGTLMSDPIDKLAMPASALAAMAKAVPTDVLRDIAATTARGPRGLAREPGRRIRDLVAGRPANGMVRGPPP